MITPDQNPKKQGWAESLIHKEIPDDLYFQPEKLHETLKATYATGPTIKRGQSRTDYGTPWLFIKAVERRFGPLSWDLAATFENCKVLEEPHYFGIEDDSLKQDWHKIRGNLWLNPPFDNIAPWAEKCSREAQLGAKILFLTPASIGSNWFRDYVNGQALVLALNGRLIFEGETTPYPKDCILSCYGWKPGFEVWTWNKEATIFD